MRILRSLFICALLAFTCVYSFPAQALAQEEHLVECFSTSIQNGKEVLIDDVGKIHVFYTVEGTELSAQEALNLIDSQENFNMETDGNCERGYDPNLSNTAVATGTYTTFYGDRVRVTPYCAGPCTISYGQSTTTGSSFSCSASLSATIKSIFVSEVTGTFGLEWNTYSSSSTSFGVTYSIPAGSTGAIYFRPRIRRYYGYYYDGSSTRYSMSGDCPLKIGNFTDGLYEVIY